MWTRQALDHSPQENKTEEADISCATKTDKLISCHTQIVRVLHIRHSAQGAFTPETDG